MTYDKFHTHTGRAAIAAFLALSATPSLAQEVGPTPEPVIDTTSETSAVPDPLAPDPETAEPLAAEPAAAEPVATTTRSAPARARTAPSRAERAPVRTRAPAADPAPVMTAEPAAPELVPSEPLAAPIPAEPPLPVAEPAPAAGDDAFEEALPIAGAAGLGLLALTGTAVALRRRRRRAEIEADEVIYDQDPAPVAAETRNDNEPAFVQPQRVAPAVAAMAAVRTDVPRTRLPNGFDLSRFGPHVQAAYLGPTPDNPSLSLKYRLRRAAAMDQRARLEAEQNGVVQPAAATAQPAPKLQPQWRASEGSFMLRRDAALRSMKPAFQK